MIESPRTIGPYELERRLGAGGMGEVFQAYDRRLDRRVAIKLIRPGQSESVTARERFRREARAAASLSHPAVVQIHDVVEVESGDAIVMELVDGESLSSRLARGPLPVAEAVRLGREIAEGLSAAHERGLLHRDLKPENVMLTASGRVKILDFGLAKRLSGEASLTEDERVVGTFGAMSPEQAGGRPLDARSDLFSLGILLYVALTGRSPFAGSSPLETMTRICTHRQPPLRDVVPAVPRPLSDLVDRLLEKEPAYRPRSAREVAAALAQIAEMERAAPTEETWVPPRGSGLDAPTWSVGRLPAGEPSSQSYSSRGQALRWAAVLALLAALVAVLVWRLPRAGPVPGKGGERPLRVVVGRPQIGAGASEPVQLLASSLEISLLRSLLGFSGIAAEADASGGPLSQVVRAQAAEEVLTSRLDCVRERCQIAFQRVRGRDGTILWSSRSFSADADDPYLVEEAVEGYLAEAYSGFPRQPGVSPLVVRPDDYARYLRLRRAYEAKASPESPSAESLIAGLAALRESSPQFVDAYVFESAVRQQRYKSSQDPADLARAAELLAEARKIAPTDPRPLSGQFGVALLRGQWDPAEQALAALERLQPGDPAILVDRARLLERRGEREAARALMREAVLKFPSWRNLLRAAHMEFAQGHFAEARSHVERLLADSPDNYEGLTLLAQIEFLHGDLDRAATLYSRLVVRYPRPLERSNLGTVLLYLRRYREAEDCFRQALAAEPRDPFALLNLADTDALLGKAGEATGLYRQVVRTAGLDATDWQVLSARAQAEAHLGESPGAVEAVQKMLRIGPEGAQIAYEASLVYAVLGDKNAALYNARRAHEQGIEPRMFALPWFDPLRGDLTRTVGPG